MSETTIDYDTNAKTTLVQCGGRLTIKLSDTKTAPWGDSPKHRLTLNGHRHHYVCTLSGPGGTYHFDFWNSVAAYDEGREPTVYDVLACLEWHVPEDFAEFCAEFGYDEDSRKALATFKRCRAQTAALNRVFPSETAREALAEIR